MLRLNDVIVIRKYSLICDAQFKVIPAAVNEQLFWQPTSIDLGVDSMDLEAELGSRLDFLQRAVDDVDRDKIADLSNLSNEFIYLMHPFEWYAYGHLFDTLQRLFPIQDLGVAQSTLLVCGSTQSVADFAQHLQVFGYESHQILGIPAYCDGIKVRNLTVAESPAGIAQLTVESVNWLRKCYLESPRFVSYLRRNESLYPEGQYILYLDRGEAGSRDLLNKHELLSNLAMLGLPIMVFKGKETVFEMLLAFSRARLVIGVHGAMFVNTIFCSPAAAIVELCPSNRVVQQMVRMPKPCLNHALVIVPGFADASIQVDPGEIVRLAVDLMLSDLSGQDAPSGEL